MQPLDHIADLGKQIMVPNDIFDATLRDLGWTWHQVARNELPPPFTSLEELQLAIICADPVLWTTAFLRNPDDPDRPWQFWDYQQESIRHEGNTLHECGAEVGKTREIIGFILYKAFNTPNGSGLVTAPMTIHLMEIIDTIT